jgi:hypothetical protein
MIVILREIESILLLCLKVNNTGVDVCRTSKATTKKYKTYCATRKTKTLKVMSNKEVGNFAAKTSIRRQGSVSYTYFYY